MSNVSLRELLEAGVHFGHQTRRWDPKMKPTICCNILDVTPEMILKHGKPDAIWASPLCTHYSMARSTAKTPRDLVACHIGWKTLTAVFSKPVMSSKGFP